MEVEIYKFGTQEKAAQLKLSKNVFATEVSDDMILEVIRWQRAAARSGTADVKNRSEIKCSKKKIYRQKGTGGARHGAKSAPIFVGGGVAFGPTPRSFAFKLNKKFRQKALRGALSSKVASNSLKLVDELEISEISTKDLKKKIESYLDLSSKKALIIDVEINSNLSSSCANLFNCKVLPVKALNVYDLMKYDVVIMSSDAAKSVEERLNVK